MVVAAAGPIDQAELCRYAQDAFGGLKPRGPEISEARPSFHGAELLYRAEDSEQGGSAHFAVGYEGVSWTHEDAITFMVMQSTLGNYKKGRASFRQNYQATASPPASHMQRRVRKPFRPSTRATRTRAFSAFTQHARKEPWRAAWENYFMA